MWFSISHNLFEGTFIYIDDLSTLPEARGKGFGGALFDYVVEKAKSEGLPAVHLDSVTNVLMHTDFTSTKE